ncbi:MAG: hypothetical protein J0I06_23595 [Planctomycetes bacterium]|nr:hypothetical protein [Planctomycetota bacterium]
MTRTDFWFLLVFVGSVVVAVAVAFGNPFRLEGNKLQEFLGYMLGLVLAAASLLAVTNFALFRRPVQDDTRNTTRTEAR